ncbi:hypothetical protein [Janthinobacterium sp. SUN033]|uniref:hypothetical protein n=1 Tax=Janthinobacterium sp. SUN033 TaxID=3002439 RepID=UPI0025AFE1F6|nr:hypothetical protein [Janthinobacterium sp. SUN033]MDN2675657.1 hypothetical protein [Janthinobacterium sp. SUN033]
MSKIKWLVFFLVISFMIGAVTLYAKYDSWVTLPKAREPVRAVTKDPESAQFKADYLTRDGWLCGEMNAKNEYGAYVGFKRFISNSTTGKIYIEGSGHIGQLSTEEILKQLDKKIALLKKQNEIKAAGGSVTKYSDSERDRIALQEVFEDHWGEICNLPH